MQAYKATSPTKPSRHFTIEDDGDAFQLALFEDGIQVGGGYFPEDMGAMLSSWRLKWAAHSLLTACKSFEGFPVFPNRRQSSSRPGRGNPALLLKTSPYC